MFPELLRFSSSSRLLEMVPEDLKNAHRPSAAVAAAAPPVMRKRHTLRMLEERDNRKAKAAAPQQPTLPPVADLWYGWGDGVEDEGACSGNEGASNSYLDESDDDVDLTEMGL